MLANKAIFLDRDGTIIVDKIYLNDPEQVEVFPEAIEGMKRLKEAGYIFLVATNQSGIPRGLVQKENLDEIHRRIQSELQEHDLEILHYYYAPYMTDSGHFQRKPEPGMLLDGARDHNVDLEKSWMLGDKMTDVEAGHRAGTMSILLGSVDSPNNSTFLPPEAWVNHLNEAAEFILAHS